MPKQLLLRLSAWWTWRELMAAEWCRFRSGYWSSHANTRWHIADAAKQRAERDDG